MLKIKKMIKNEKYGKIKKLNKNEEYKKLKYGKTFKHG